MQTESGRAADHGRFVLVGGRPALDLVATLGRRHTEPIERLPDPSALARWLVAAGIVPTEPAVDEENLRRARALREVVNGLVRAVLAGRVPDPVAVAEINRQAAEPDLPVRLHRDGDGALVAAPASGHVRAALAGVARDAIRLLGGPQAARIKECAHPGCSLVFLDETQSGRRRWCSMDRCGNLVKTAGYRARRADRGRTTAPPPA